MKLVELLGAAAILCPLALPAQQVAACPTCAEASALIARFGLREAASPVRESPRWSAPRRIVTVGGEQWAAALREVAPGVEVIGVANAQEALRVIAGADALVGGCTRELLEAGVGLKWIQLPSAGAESCAGLPALARRGILVTNAQGIYGPEIAEHVMAMILSFARQLHTYHAEQQRGQWSPGARGAIPDEGAWELDGKALLVVGLGGIGTEVARRGHALGMRVRATRHRGREGPEFVEHVGLADELLDLARWADVVVNATPLTPDTRGLFDARFFQAMKPTAYFINIGRGASVVTADLVGALEKGQIAGAGLDVADPEPLPPGHPLWSMPGVILTPHVAAASDLRSRRLNVLIRENVRRYVTGDKLLSVVDLQRGY